MESESSVGAAEAGRGGEVLIRGSGGAGFEGGASAEGAASDIFGGNWEVLVVAGDSTCWRVVLKYRARFGRRKVGGRTVDSIRTSKADFRNVLVNILRLAIVCGLINGGDKIIGNVRLCSRS